jgi:hypothetical protein
MRLLALAIVALFSSTLARADYGAHLGAHFGYGQMGNSSGDENRTRNMGTLDLQAMPGIKLYGNALLLGLMLDYRFMSQLTDETNLSSYGGRGFLAGPGALLDFSFGRFLFSWDMRARHYYSGPDTTYKGSGFHFLFGYKVMGNLCADLEYVISRYNAVRINEVETGLDENKQVTHKSLGFGLSWLF